MQIGLFCTDGSPTHGFSKQCHFFSFFISLNVKALLMHLGGKDPRDHDTIPIPINLVLLESLGETTGNAIHSPFPDS